MSVGLEYESPSVQSVGTCDVVSPVNGGEPRNIRKRRRTSGTHIGRVHRKRQRSLNGVARRVAVERKCAKQAAAVRGKSRRRHRGVIDGVHAVRQDIRQVPNLCGLIRCDNANRRAVDRRSLRRRRRNLSVRHIRQVPRCSKSILQTPSHCSKAHQRPWYSPFPTSRP